MLRTETLRARRSSSETLTAWDLIFRGMWHFYHVTRDHHLIARDLFRKAIAVAPDIAEGHIWLARSNGGLLFFGWSNEAADEAEGWQAAKNATRIAEADPYAHYAVGVMSIMMGRPERAMQAGQRAIDLSPSFALGYLLLGSARLFAGRAALAIEPLQRGLRLSPHDPHNFMWLLELAFAHFLLGEHEEAALRASDAVDKRPESFAAHCALACSLAKLERHEEAKRAVDEMRRVARRSDVDTLLTRFADASDRERILHGLQQAGWQE